MSFDSIEYKSNLRYRGNILTVFKTGDFNLIGLRHIKHIKRDYVTITCIIVSTLLIYSLRSLNTRSRDEMFKIQSFHSILDFITSDNTLTIGKLTPKSCLMYSCARYNAKSNEAMGLTSSAIHVPGILAASCKWNRMYAVI